jgi:hypothetical protein
MPILVIYGIPAETHQGDLQIFAQFMKNRVADVEELKIKPEQVTIFCPQDLMNQGLGEEIIVFVESLFERPERTDEVKKKLAMNLVDEVHLSFPRAELIECIIRPLTQEQGYFYGKLQPDGGFWGDGK